MRDVIPGSIRVRKVGENGSREAEIAAVTVSPVMAVMVTSPVTKSSLVRSPVKELSPVRDFQW